ncbi:hypothetical protein A2U01_0118003 [Trifolium medium]|uniref:Uncharacterized protein n=1 Tax=Trifolium medium TaxID=97028 RepID=A0A392WA78_9FABA|nr:hypothetical protein [Trifolium medium]
MDRNEAVFYEQYGAHMRAQEEQRAPASASAAAASHGSPIFTYGELGLDDSPGDFQNFMDPPASG